LFARNSGKGTGSGGGPSSGGEKSFLHLAKAQRLYCRTFSYRFI